MPVRREFLKSLQDDPGIAGDAAKKVSSFQAFYDARERILPWIKEYSPYELVSKDDPAVGLYFPTVPNLGKDEKDATHSANFGVRVIAATATRTKRSGVRCFGRILAMAA